MVDLDIDRGVKVPARPLDGFSDIAIAQAQAVAAPVNQVECERRLGALHSYLQAAHAGLCVGAGGEGQGENQSK